MGAANGKRSMVTDDRLPSWRRRRRRRARRICRLCGFAPLRFIDSNPELAQARRRHLAELGFGCTGVGMSRSWHVELKVG